MDRSAFLLGMATIMTPKHAGTPAPGVSQPPGGASAPVRIAVLGDSLALGTGALRADGGFIFRAYRALLATRPGSTVDNVAIGGATVADVVRLQVARLTGTHYDVVVVCVGGNDVVRFTPAQTFARTYATLLARIAQTAPGARIVCCGVPDVSVSPIFTGDFAVIREAAMANDRAVRGAAKAAGAAFVDLFAVSRSKRDAERFLGRDRFHPSDAGYKLLAAALEPVLEQSVTR